MKLFLIDYENVNSAGLEGISLLNEDDRVILFYSQSANTLSFDVFDELMQARVFPEKVNLNQSGKNALDFQLVTYLGYLIAKENAEEYYIISRDTGYAATIHFCKTQLGTKVQMKPSIKAAFTGKTPVAVKKMSAVAVPAAPRCCEARAESEHTSLLTAEEVLAAMDPPVSPDIAAQILECMSRCKNESEFHNALQNQFRNANTKHYYHHLKRFFREMKSED